MEQPGTRVFIDLSSDDDDGTTDDEVEYYDARTASDPVDLLTLDDDIGNDQGDLHALMNIPDIDVPPHEPIIIEDDEPQVHPPPLGKASQYPAHPFSEAECLQLFLNVFPDIAVEHVLKIVREKTTDATRTSDRCEQLITELLDAGPYPKEHDSRGRKRKRDGEDDFSEYEKEDRDPKLKDYDTEASQLLRDEFTDVPARHIDAMIAEKRTLFRAYVAIEGQRRANSRLFSRLKKARVKKGIAFILIEKGSKVPKELEAAKRKVQAEADLRRKAEDEQKAEEANLQHAQMNNEMGTCECCFGDEPLNRMIFCNGETIHLYCRDCLRRLIETEMGQSRCRPKCFGVENCPGTFTRKMLRDVLCDKTLERLERMQQLDDIKAAGLDFLSECPFCDFKMECPPVDVDKEFRCRNQTCGITSCRLCDKETHVPLSCEEAKKDGKLTLRHVVEEAMSAALIRHCNQCKHPFVKEYGCNKMTCSHCRNLQCYVCSQNVRDYDHFGPRKCPLHDDVEGRHEQEVKQAADAAMAKVRAEHPEMSNADLMLQVSDAVKRAEEARKNRAPGQPGMPPMVNADHALHRARAQFAAIPLPPRIQIPMPPFPAPQVGIPAAAPLPPPPPPPGVPFLNVFQQPFLEPPCPRCHMYHGPNQCFF